MHVAATKACALLYAVVKDYPLMEYAYDGIPTVPCDCIICILPNPAKKPTRRRAAKVRWISRCNTQYLRLVYSSAA